MAIIQKKKRIYRKRIPYGIQNFEDIRKRDCYYVDKTQFIEDSNMYFFFIRPRRFGKSITLSMLENYYDLNFAIVVGGLDDYKKGLDEYCNTQFNYFVDVSCHSTILLTNSS